MKTVQTAKKLYHLLFLSTVLLCVNTLPNLANAHPHEPQEYTRILKLSTFRDAMQAYQKQDFDAATLGLSKLLRQFPNNPILLNNLAVIASKNNQHEQAIEYLKAAIASNQFIQLSYKNLSAIYLYRAAVAYRQALALDIEDAQTLELDVIDQVIPAQVAPTTQLVQNILETTQLDEPLVEDPEASVSNGRPQAQDQSRNPDVLAIRQRVMRWAQAWSKQDTAGYFASYMPNYTTGNLSHQAWVQMRAQRVRAPRNISVGIEGIKINVLSKTQATAVFRQNYKSNILTSSVIKQLKFIRYRGEWKITDEQVVS